MGRQWARTHILGNSREANVAEAVRESERLEVTGDRSHRAILCDGETLVLSLEMGCCWSL